MENWNNQHSFQFNTIQFVSRLFVCFDNRGPIWWLWVKVNIWAVAEYYDCFSSLPPPFAFDGRLTSRPKLHTSQVCKSIQTRLYLSVCPSFIICMFSAHEPRYIVHFDNWIKTSEEKILLLLSTISIDPISIMPIDLGLLCAFALYPDQGLSGSITGFALGEHKIYRFIEANEWTTSKPHKERWYFIFPLGSNKTDLPDFIQNVSFSLRDLCVHFGPAKLSKQFLLSPFFVVV